MSIWDTAKQVFRDYVLDGVPASGANEPSKSEIRGLFRDIEDQLPPGNPNAPVDLDFATPLTPDLNDGRAFKLTATANFTLNPPANLVDGAVFWVRITQDGTGGRTITFDAAYRFPGGSVPSLSTGAGDADMLYAVVVDAATPVIDAALRKDV